MHKHHSMQNWWNQRIISNIILVVLKEGRNKITENSRFVRRECTGRDLVDALPQLLILLVIFLRIVSDLIIIIIMKLIMIIIITIKILITARIPIFEHILQKMWIQTQNLSKFNSQDKRRLDNIQSDKHECMNVFKREYPIDIIIFYTDPFFHSSATPSTVSPKMKIFSAPISSIISTLAPSSVPIVRAPFNYKIQTI